MFVINTKSPEIKATMRSHRVPSSIATINELWLFGGYLEETLCEDPIENILISMTEPVTFVLDPATRYKLQQEGYPMPDKLGPIDIVNIGLICARIGIEPFEIDFSDGIITINESCSFFDDETDD